MTRGCRSLCAMHWTAIDEDGWTADYRVREVTALLPTRVEGRWAWPSTSFFVLECRYHATGQPVTRPLDWIGREPGLWRRVGTAWTAWALHRRHQNGLQVMPATTDGPA